MSELSDAINEMRNMRESYDQIGAAAEAYNEGKPALAEAISAKGVETAATDSLATMAEKVMTISQDTYEIDGGEMYAKQLFGVANNDIVPGYWNLYDILAQLLSDGRLVNYGGILLAEYYRGYDSLALSGAGAGGAYVVSDKDENGQFKMYTNDTTHTWATEFDGKGNRWVAYCFADEYHDFQITDTNTSPRSIFIGRKVGTITSLVDGRCSQLVVADGNKLHAINTVGTNQNWAPNTVIGNIEEVPIGTILMTLSPINYGSIYIKVGVISGSLIGLKTGTNTTATIGSLIVCADEINGTILNYLDMPSNSIIGCVVVNCKKIAHRRNDTALFFGNSAAYIPYIVFNDIEEMSGNIIWPNSKLQRVDLNYSENDKTKSVTLKGYGGTKNVYPNLTDVVLKDGWCKPLDLHYASNNLTKANVQAHIFDRLGVNDLSTGAVTITLATAVLNLFTQEETDAVVARTNITIVGA